MAASCDGKNSLNSDPNSTVIGPSPSEVSPDGNEVLSENQESSEESELFEESESFDSAEDSSGSESIYSESEISHAQQRISKVKGTTDYDRSIQKLSSLTKHSFRILSFYSRKYGETHCRLAKYYMKYAESFFMYLRLQLESGSNDENEDESVRDDWDVLCECLRRSISASDRLVKIEGSPECGGESPIPVLRQALEMIIWVYVYREDKKAALKAAEDYAERFPCPTSSLILAEMHVLCEHFSTARSIISTLRASKPSPALSAAETEKIDELYELLFENDASNIKWDVGNYVRNEYSASVKKGTTGNVVTTFSKPVSTEGISTAKSTTIVPTRRKRKDPDEKVEGES
ncbi:hypothetical protein XU18_3748 [Perkinsela sp. CCAP 1560/4]|nr:hypothetical protein XU18_3748 [Perkinsela sp. CCAP 1560/4]|eukprot:KNH05185.1 hypothetical protein XU18_3748 [Perkinsela sp. CCAP 1560/4]